MARIIDSMVWLSLEKVVTSCNKCKKVIAFNRKEIFLDLSYGPGYDGEESVKCPQCNSVLHIGEFHATEHM